MSEQNSQTTQLDLFGYSVDLVECTKEYLVCARSRNGAPVCCWVKAETRLPYHETIIIDTAPVLRHAKGMNWGRFMSECKVERWESLTTIEGAKNGSEHRDRMDRSHVEPVAGMHEGQRRV